VEAFEQLKREVNEAVGAINGRWGSATWQPVLSLSRGFPLTELVALYLAADLCLVTPLRDGMNLVAKEYVLCREDGLVLLSEFAGAAVDLPEAVLVNPFDPEGVAEAMHRALSLPMEERQARFTGMKARCEARDLAWWGRAFLKRLEEAALASA
jgi:trehalose-6-phosphate synthase